MSRLLKMAWFEYRRHVLTWRFLIISLGLPLFIAAVAGATVAVTRRADVVDEAAWAVVGDDPLPGPAVARLADEGVAAAAFDAGAIEGYVVLAPDGRATARGVAPPPTALESALASRARESIVAEVPADRRALVAHPVEVQYSALGTESAPPASGARLGMTLLVALAMPLGFVAVVLFATNYLIQAVTEEKVNRVLEILLTTLSPTELIAGKLVGLSLLSLTQTAVWGISAIGLGVAFIGPPAHGLLAAVPWAALGVSGLYFGLGYLLYALIMVGIGIAVGQPREAQQVAGFVTLMLILPSMLVVVILVAPTSRLAVMLSLLPPSAPVAMPVRILLSAASDWEIAGGLVLLAATLWLAIIGVGRVFRASMLLYGQRLNVRGLVAALRA